MHRIHTKSYQEKPLRPAVEFQSLTPAAYAMSRNLKEMPTSGHKWHPVFPNGSPPLHQFTLPALSQGTQKAI